MIRRTRLAAPILAMVALLTLGASSAWAGGPPVFNETQHLANVPDTIIDVDPCTGQPAQISVVQTGVIHFSAFADGTVHVTGTLRGTFSVDLLPTDGTADATGSFTVWFGSNGQMTEDGTAFGKAETTLTLNGKGTTADGVSFSFHNNSHAVFDAAGNVKLEFFKSHCN